jgi:acylphosphatase
MIQDHIKRVLFRVSGKVQGVGYRWFVIGEAERLSLKGWVRNTPDGSVEVEVEGPAYRVDLLRDRLSKGPPASRVSRVDELSPGSYELPDRFEIIR